MTMDAFCTVKNELVMKKAENRSPFRFICSRDFIAVQFIVNWDSIFLFVSKSRLCISFQTWEW